MADYEMLAVVALIGAAVYFALGSGQRNGDDSLLNYVDSLEPGQQTDAEKAENYNDEVTGQMGDSAGGDARPFGSGPWGS